jgi:hypothetical protein
VHLEVWHLCIGDFNGRNWCIGGRDGREELLGGCGQAGKVATLELQTSWTRYQGFLDRSGFGGFGFLDVVVLEASWQGRGPVYVLRVHGGSLLL